MSRSKHAPPATAPAVINWPGIHVPRIEYDPGATIFTQGTLRAA
jgi:hypothetical protein